MATQTEEKSSRVLIVIDEAPFVNWDSWEGLRLSLSFYAADIPVEILLTGDGVLNWISGMTKESQDSRSVLRFVKDIENFAVPLYLVEEDLKVHQLDVNDLTSKYPRLIVRETAAKMIANHDSVLTM